MSENTISSEYEIDEDIIELVKFCNNNGIKTLASCSGTIKDHGELKGSGQKVGRRIWCMGREKAVWTCLYGNLPHYFPDQ